MSTVCAAGCGKTKFINPFVGLCNNPLGAKVLKVGLSLCGVDLACPTVQEDIEAQITAGTFVLLAPVEMEWAAPTHNYDENNYSYSKPKSRKDSTYSGVIRTPYNIDNDAFMEEINAGSYKDMIFSTEDGIMFKVGTTRLSLAVGTGPDGQNKLAHIIEFEFIQKAGTLQGFKGRAPIYEAEDA